MLRRRLTHWEVEIALREPIRKWTSKPTINPPLCGDLIKRSLQTLLRRAKKLFPKSRVTTIGADDCPLHNGNCNYFWQLVKLDELLSNKRWFSACDLLIDMLHYYQVEDRRILGTLISILEVHLR